MAIKFSIKDRTKQTIYSCSKILNFCNYLENEYKKNNFKFFVIYGGANSSSLFLITTLFLSRCNYAVSPESFNKEKIEKIFGDQSIKIIDQEYLDEFLKINNQIIHNFSEIDNEIKWKKRIKKSIENNERIIGYFSSGSTGEPKLIPVSSKLSSICHEKVINLSLIHI